MEKLEVEKQTHTPKPKHQPKSANKSNACAAAKIIQTYSGLFAKRWFW